MCSKPFALFSLIFLTTYSSAIAQSGPYMSSDSQPPPGSGYTIKGHIAGLEDGEKVIMQMVTGYNFQFVDWDSTVVKDGQFFLKGLVPEGPRTYWLHLGKKRFKVIVLTLDNNENVTIRSDKNFLDIPHGYLSHWVDIEGNTSGKGARYLFNGFQFWMQSLNMIDKQLKHLVDSVGFDRTAYDQLYTLRRDMTNNFYALFLKNPEPDYLPVIPELANAMFELSHRAEFWSTVYDSLSEHLKNSFDAKLLKEKLPLSTGQPFPLFTLPTIDGKLLALKDIIVKSKITLVQFYSSNSVDVDRYQEELQVSYKKYHAKGLNIVGVSSDTMMKRWKVDAADLPWEQVSDLKGENGVVGKVYKEYGIHGTPQPNTTNVLIDSKGEIVGWDVSGPELQWYLWKAFGE